MVRKYDDRGYELEQSYFGLSNEPVLHADGSHKMTNAYDERGKLIENRFTDTQGNLVVSDGRAIARTKYDDRGNEVEVAYYGVHNEPLIRRPFGPIDPAIEPEVHRRYGVARAMYQYDDSNRKITEEFFGPDGKPMSDLQGIAKVSISYDANGKSTQHFFNVVGIQVSPNTARK
jgi:hypothetical protein